MSKRINILGVLLLFAVAAVSCRYNELEPEPGVSNGGSKGKAKISFVLGNAASEVIQTKSASAPVCANVKELLTVTDTDSLCLLASVVDNNDPVFPTQTLDTKAAPVTIDNIGEFYVTAFLSPEVKYFNNVALGNEDKDADTQLYTMDYYWPNGQMDFFAANFKINKLSSSPSLDNLDEIVANPNWTKSSGALIVPENGVFGYDEAGICVGTFSYALPPADPNVKRDAENQPDYVVAIADGISEDTNNGVVELDFAHCFTAVVFKIGDEFLNPEGRQVKEVSVSGVAASGECTYTLSNTGAIAFDWNTQNAPSATYTQVIPAEEADVDNKEVVNDAELTFMLIPHAIREDAVIRITFAMHTGMDSEYHHETTAEMKIKDLFPEIVEKRWLPGKKYIYTIASEEKVDVTVTDEFTSTSPMIKGNLQITNNGTAVAYVRAMIVGWWENASGVVVAPWNESDGEFAGIGWDGNNKWLQWGDGFYYYSDPLSPGASTAKLFETYTLKADPPIPGSRLVLAIVAQGVIHYRAEEAWPVTFSAHQ